MVTILSVHCSFGKLHWINHSLSAYFRLQLKSGDCCSYLLRVWVTKQLWLHYNDSSQIFLHPEHHHNVVLEQKLVHKVRVRFTLPAVGCRVGKAPGLLLSFLDAVHQEGRWMVGPLLPAVQLSRQFVHKVGLC